ncbi:MAG: hypothetical protein JW757_04340 [Anaerolineales bacterium]|nr:hypothetical protein [Anaerolineales bacterium]
MTTIFNTIFSTGTLLETEHGLVMLLLLYGLLTFRDQKVSRWVPLVIIGGILLSLLTPVHGINLFWPVITALIVPPFLWQAAVAVTKSGPLGRRWSLGIWLIMLILITLSLRIFSQLPVSNAMLLSILTVTLVWYFREFNVERSYLSTIGLITLVILLVEIDLVLVSLRLWLGTLISGAAVGIAIGFLGIAIFRRIKKIKSKNAFFFAWAYVAYLIGLAFETSAIATTLAAALVVSTYGFSIGLWYSQREIPVPSNFRFFFYLATLTWLVLGWQAHTKINVTSLTGIVPVLVVVTIGILVIQKLTPISTENRWGRLLRKEGGVFLLLFGAILFWPQQAFLTTISVEIALGTAILLIVLLRFTLKPLFDMIGIPLSWPDKEEHENNAESNSK